MGLGLRIGMEQMASCLCTCVADAAYENCGDADAGVCGCLVLQVGMSTDVEVSFLSAVQVCAGRGEACGVAGL